MQLKWIQKTPSVMLQLWEKGNTRYKQTKGNSMKYQIFIVATALLWFDKLEGTHWVALAIALIGANQYQKYLAKDNGGCYEKPYNGEAG